MRRGVGQLPDGHVPTAVVVLDRAQTRARVRIPKPERSVARHGDDVFVRNGNGVHRGAVRAEDVLAAQVREEVGPNCPVWIGQSSAPSCTINPEPEASPRS